MSITSIQLQLWIGRVVPQPATRELMTALQSVEITQSETAGFQMSFQIERSPYMSSDFALMTSDLLQPGSRVVICVTLSATPRVVMDGIITQHQFSYDQSGAMMLTVTGEDISLLMDMYDVSLEYPGMEMMRLPWLFCLNTRALASRPWSFLRPLEQYRCPPSAFRSRIRPISSISTLSRQSMDTSFSSNRDRPPRSIRPTGGLPAVLAYLKKP